MTTGDSSSRVMLNYAAILFLLRFFRSDSYCFNRRRRVFGGSPPRLDACYHGALWTGDITLGVDLTKQCR
jgi:hypothetical protein